MQPDDANDDPGSELRRQVYQEVKAVIAWEMAAQAAIRRSFADIPALVADSILDFFDVVSKPGATFEFDAGELHTYRVVPVGEAPSAS